MLNKKRIYFILVFLLIITTPLLSYAQKTIKNDSNFVLNYKSEIDNSYDSMVFTFVGDFILRQDFGRVAKILGEPRIQILDLRNNSVYEYYLQTKRLFNTTKPFQMSSEPNTIINRKDSSINGDSYNYFLVSKENEFGNLPITSHVFFLKDFKLPTKYQAIRDIYGGKNTLFPTYTSEIIFSYLSKEGSKTINYFVLDSIKKSDYSEEEIKNVINQLKD